jgi:predicted double-glycine peptidase
LTNFRLLSRSRQSTEYTCGPSALQAVLRYWGRDVAEDKIAELCKTTAEVGTHPEDLVRGAQALGFKATAKANLTLDEVAKFTAMGHPMIALAQVWLSQSKSKESVEDEWDSGHYIVVLGVDKDNVYFQDPYVLMSKAFMPRKLFEAHWHQVMGGDVKKDPKLMHVVIFVRGVKPARSRPAEGLKTAKLDFQKMGSLNLIVMQFAGILRPYDFLTELNDLWASGQIRPNAFILLQKDKRGAITGMEGGRLKEADDVAATNALIAAITSRSLGGPELARSKMDAAVTAAAEGDFGLSASDIRALSRKLPRNHSAIAVLVENVWERRLKEVVAKHRGAIADQRLVSSAAVAKAAARLAVGGKRVSARQ